MTSTTDHPKFTEIRFADLPGQGLTRDTAPRNWTELHDLAVEAAETNVSLSFEQWRIVIDSVANGLPVRLTYANGTGRLETTTAILTQLTTLATDVYSLHIRKWGGGHPIVPASIYEIEVPETSWSDPHEHPALDSTPVVLPKLGDAVLVVPAGANEKPEKWWTAYLVGFTPDGEFRVRSTRPDATTVQTVSTIRAI